MNEQQKELRQKLEQYYRKRQKQPENRGFIFTKWDKDKNFLGQKVHGLTCYGVNGKEVNSNTVIGVAVISDKEAKSPILDRIKKFRIEKSKAQIKAAEAVRNQQ